MKLDWLRCLYLLAVVFIVTSCVSKTSEEGRNSGVAAMDSLALFPLGCEMEFVGTNSRDQIAIHFSRETDEIFNYRVELLRKWKGLPVDYGTVRAKEIRADSTYVFEGGNSDCTITFRIQKSTESWTKFLASVERKCDNENFNINLDDFPRLWYKGGSLDF